MVDEEAELARARFTAFLTPLVVLRRVADSVARLRDALEASEPEA